MPKFHTLDSTGTYMLLVSEEMLVLLKKWREDGYLYQAAYRVDTSDVQSVLPDLDIKSARLDSTSSGEL